MANDVFELAIKGLVAGEYVENVLAFQSANVSSATPESDAQDLIDEWVTNIEPAWLSCLSDDYILGGYSAKRVNNTGGNAANELRPGQTGAVGFNSITSGTGALLTADYYNAGGSPPRWRVARIFVPGTPESMIVQNEIQDPLGTNLRALIVLMNTTIGSGPFDWTYGVWSRTQKVFYTVGPLEISNLVGTQRKRLRPTF